MAAKLKPYPAYKDSGVPWLGEVPAHWEVRRLAQIGKLSKGSGGSKDDEVPTGIPCIRYGDLYTTHNYFIRKSRSFIPKDKTPEYTAIKFGDVLFAGSGETIDEIGKSAVNLMQKEACCGGDIILFRPVRQIEPRYLGYATDCRPAAAQKAIMGRGITVMHLYGTQLKYLNLPLPPLPEQTAIVRFLDHADRRIRRYIRAKQKLIALLEEQKQALIHQAVTGQTDVRTGRPYPAYKPSGLEWLGDVPAHWERHRLKTLLRSVDRRSTTGKETLLSLRRDHGVVVYAEHFARPPQGRTLVGFKLAAVGQLVVNRMQANNGLVFCSGINGLVSPDYSVFEMREPLQMQYLSDLLRTSGYRTHFRREATGLGTGTAGFLRLYDEKLLETIVFLPPVEEQILIRKSLAEGMARIERLVEREQRELQLIGEYRTRLIADVVTGQLDVREATTALPEGAPLAAEDTPDDAIDTAAT